MDFSSKDDITKSSSAAETAGSISLNTEAVSLNKDYQPENNKKSESQISDTGIKISVSEGGLDSVPAEEKQDFQIKTGKKPSGSKTKAPAPGTYEPPKKADKKKRAMAPPAFIPKQKEKNSKFDEDYCPPSDPEELSQDIYVSPQTVMLAVAAVCVIIVGLLGWTGYKYFTSGNDSSPKYEAAFSSGKNMKMHLSGAEWASLSSGSKIKTGSMITTSSTPDNVLSLPNDATLRADSNTSFKLESIKDTGDTVTVHATLIKGRVFAADTEKTKINISTKYCNIVPVGTKYCVNQAEKENLTEQTEVIVLEGSVRVTHALDSTANTLVTVNNKTVVTETSIEKPVDIEKKKKGNWLKWNLSWNTPSEMAAAASMKKADPKAKAKKNSSQPTYNAAEDENMRANVPDMAPQSSAPASSGYVPQQAPPQQAPQQDIQQQEPQQSYQPQSQSNQAPPPMDHFQNFNSNVNDGDPSRLRPPTESKPKTYSPKNTSTQAPPKFDLTTPPSVGGEQGQFAPVKGSRGRGPEPLIHGSVPPPPSAGNPNGGQAPPPPNPNGNQAPPPNPNGERQMLLSPQGTLEPAQDRSHAVPLDDNDLLHSVTDNKNNRSLLNATTEKNYDPLKASNYNGGR